MDVLMELDDGHIEGALGKEFVARGLCPELSLGYNVTMSKSPAGFLRATNKRVVELSLVRLGARDGCKIRAFTQGTGSSAAGAGKRFSSSGLLRGKGSVADAAGSGRHVQGGGDAKRHKILV
jgi:hypothetical protein